jgi:GNAT superfamily N-acetyltransferase
MTTQRPDTTEPPAADAVVDLTAAQTHDLRARVLRSGTVSTDVAWEGDDTPGTRHLGIVREGVVVATSTWIPQPFPDEPDRRAVRLRGMATDPEYRGAGLGRRLLDSGCDRAARSGFDLVWAHARSTALDFYLSAGFVTRGEEFVEVATGLPHQLVSRRLDAAGVD